MICFLFVPFVSTPFDSFHFPSLPFSFPALFCIVFFFLFFLIFCVYLSPISFSPFNRPFFSSSSHSLFFNVSLYFLLNLVFLVQCSFNFFLIYLFQHNHRLPYNFSLSSTFYDCLPSFPFLSLVIFFSPFLLFFSSRSESLYFSHLFCTLLVFFPFFFAVLLLFSFSRHIHPSPPFLLFHFSLFLFLFPRHFSFLIRLPLRCGFPGTAASQPRISSGLE